jgi:dienelactone hydrolase
MKVRINAKLLTVLIAACCPSFCAAPIVEILSMPDGMRFGVLGAKPASPKPTVFWLGKTIEETLNAPLYHEALATLGDGVLNISLDMPGHGADHRGDEPTSLSSWRYRLDHGEDIAASFVKRASGLLDYLLKERYTDPAHIAVFGISRGGLMSLHFAAADARVGTIVLFSPVTDLLQLQELSQMEHPERARALAAVRLANRLYKDPIWISIGNTDHRVGTRQAIEFDERIIEVSEAQGLVPPIELRVLPTSGHTTPYGAYVQAASWLLTQWHLTGPR